MTVRPSVIVLGWLGANVILIAVLFGFGESLVGELLYLCSAVPVLAFAIALGWRNRGERSLNTPIPLPFGTGYAAVAAIGALLLGLGLIFATWIAILGGLLLAWVVLQLWRAPRPRAAPILDEPHD
jgi:hypothetical protein